MTRDQNAAPPELKIKTLPHHDGLPLPAYATEIAAGLDLAAAVSEALTLEPGERAAVPTGIALAIPRGYEGQVRARSGLAREHGIGVINAPGTIDSDYRGEIMVLLINLGHEPFLVTRGMRIAQLVIAPVNRVTLTQVDQLDDTERGEAGFGSTGGMGDGTGDTPP